ncbi:MAG: protein kinase [Myxococcales bacterium]|nr:protein kinase [Myxococcales bacterium]
MNETRGDGTPDEEPPPLLQPGVVIDRYLIKRLIGRGGMGEVYEAVHQDIKKRVALKTLDPSAARNVEARARFLREGEAASRIQHPHIVNVTDVGTSEGMLYLVMEYLEGEDLDARLRREGALSPEQAVDVLIPVLAAVNAAHQVGVVHRDLKPSNIFLSQNPDGAPLPKVLDFGISKLVDPQSNHNLTRSAAVIGTPLYMAPEQAHSSKASDARSDQYSLGVILYQCVTGHLPFEAETYFALLTKIVLGEFPKPRERKPELPEELEATILRAMAKEPNDRFESIQAFGRALLPFAGEEVRVVFRRTFGNAGETAAHKALVATPSSAPSMRPPQAEPPLASTLTAAAGERRPEVVASDLKRKAPLIAGVALVAALVVGLAARGRSPSAPDHPVGPLAGASTTATGLADAGATIADGRSAEPANVPVAAHDSADGGVLAAAQTRDAGASRGRGRARDPLRGFLDLFSSPRRSRPQSRTTH